MLAERAIQDSIHKSQVQREEEDRLRQQQITAEAQLLKQFSTESANKDEILPLRHN